MLRWLWPVFPALLVAIVVANSDWIDRRCPAYTTSLPPHPEQCLPTLLPDLTGADPLLVAISWVTFPACVYGLIAIAGLAWHGHAVDGDG